MSNLSAKEVPHESRFSPALFLPIPRQGGIACSPGHEFNRRPTHVKTLLVTSRVTFVPENYGRLVAGLANNPHVAAVLFLENRGLLTPAMGAGLWLSRLAPGIGAELVRNTLSSLHDPREHAMRAAGKCVFHASHINAPETIAILARFDLVINARTRFIYGGTALAAPRIGCVNIHHGLLPDQRGLLCDLWAQAEGRPTGFTIHRMAAELDAGEIIARHEVEVVQGRRFVDHALASSIEELSAIEQVLDRVGSAGRIEGIPNTKTPATRYYRTPGLAEMVGFKKKGIQL
jgi:hypothetical protein